MQNSKPIPRREFLRRTGGLAVGAGAVLAAPSIFLNQTRAATGSNPGDLVRVGIIGAGGMGRSHLFAHTMVKNVVAVCDPDVTRVAAVQKDFQTRQQREIVGYQDYRQMLDNREIDAVIVATPDHWHALPGVHACQAGKDVYIEKPLTLTIHEGWALLRAARYYRRILQTGSQQRSSSEFFRAASYVRSERIGKVNMVRVGLPGVNWTNEAAVPDSEPPADLDYDLWLGPAPWRPYNKHRVHYYFRFFWDYSGGQMTNWGAHHLDIAQWALGMDETGPVQVSARAEYDPQGRYEVPSWFEIIYRFPNGAEIVCGQSHRIGATFEGSEGTLYVNRGRIQSSVRDVLEEPIRDDEAQLYRSANHHQNWLDCIKSRELPICDVAIGHRSATVCHLGNIACRLGRTIRWDPEKEQILGDAEAARMVGYEYRAPWKLPMVG